MSEELPVPYAKAGEVCWVNQPLYTADQVRELLRARDERAAAICDSLVIPEDAEVYRATLKAAAAAIRANNPP